MSGTPRRATPPRLTGQVEKHWVATLTPAPAQRAASVPQAASRVRRVTQRSHRTPATESSPLPTLFLAAGAPLSVCADMWHRSTGR